MTQHIARTRPSSTSGALAPLQLGARTKRPTASNPQAVIDTAKRAAAANTRRAYAYDWAVFTDWCATEGLDPLPCSEQTLADFNRGRLEAGCSLSTVQRGMMSIRKAQTTAGFPDPFGVVARQHWKGARRDFPSDPDKATPLYDHDIEMMVNLLSSRCLRGLRDRALLLVGINTGMRRSELMALKVQDLRFVDEGDKQGVIIHIRRGKTDQEGKGRVTAALKRNDRYCSVSALRNWIEAARLTDYVFVAVRGRRRLSKTPLDAGQLNRIIKALVHRAGIDARVGNEKSRYSAHSLRTGIITMAHARGERETNIMDLVGHKSLANHRGYIQEDVFARSMSHILKFGPGGA